MKKTNMFQSLLNHHSYNKEEQFLKDKITTVNIILLLLGSIVLTFSIIRFTRTEYLIAVVDFIFFITLMTEFYFLRKDKKHLLLISRISIFMSISIAFFLIIVMPDVSTRFAWLYIVTYMIFYLLDLKEGCIWFFGMLSVLFGLFLANIIQISILELAVLVVTILFLAFFLMQYEAIKYKSQTYLLNYAQTLQDTVDEKVLELQEQKDTFEYLFQKSFDGTLLIEDGKFIEFNDAIVKMLWYSDADNMLNLSFGDISPKYQDDGELSEVKAQKMIEKCLKNGAHNFEWILKKSYGVKFWSDITLTHLRLKNKYIIHAVIRDITDKKELEQENKKMYENLEDKVLKRTQELEIAMKAKGDFLANMSHEIRTPLNAILGFISILKKTEQDTKRLSYLNIIYTSGQSLLTIINDILDFSKVENGKLELENTKFHVSKPFKDVYELLNEKAKENNIALVLDLDEDLPEYVKGDIERVKQIFSNIVSNAIKFTPKGGHINTSVSYDISTYHLSCKISDTGIGMDKEQLEKIFDSFSQADSSTTRKFGGTGLGLSICKRLVDLMNGTIEVKSVVGEGSVFSFSIELLPDEGELAKLEKNRQKKEDRFNVASKLLVVEDNKTNQELMKIMLMELDLSCDIAKNGLEAVKLMKENTYSIVFMDENMPIMNGIEATRQIRELDLKYTPIVAVTANALKGDKDKFIEAGMDDYIAKPIEYKELIRVLKKYLLIT